MASRSFQRRAEATAFDTTLRMVAGAARAKSGEWVSGLLAWVAKGVRRYRGATPGRLSGAELGQEWQRLMPNPKVMPITHVDGETAYGEIQIRCPLRGTGDVRACHRLMAYDRALMRPAGARFVVLESQAEPGVEHCRIAIRPADLPSDDLVPAITREGSTQGS